MEGRRARADADAYADYMRETGFAAYGETPGNRGAWLLRRDDGDRTEFITLSMWDSYDAIQAFAGDDIEAAVLYPEDERYLIDGCSAVTHYEVADAIAPPAAAPYLRPSCGPRKASAGVRMAAHVSPAWCSGRYPSTGSPPSARSRSTRRD